jgi:hypothetical protein
MWRRVDIVRTDVSGERIASIFRVEKYCLSTHSLAYLYILIIILFIYYKKQRYFS